MSEHNPLASGDWVWIYVTAPSVEEAKRIGRTLVEERSVACANILPQMQSLYIWEAQLEESNEAVLILKTHQSKLKEVETRIHDLHTYSIPCFLAFHIDRVSQPYLEWMAGNLLNSAKTGA